MIVGPGAAVQRRPRRRQRRVLPRVRPGAAARDPALPRRLEVTLAARLAAAARRGCVAAGGSLAAAPAPRARAATLARPATCCAPRTPTAASVARRPGLDAALHRLGGARPAPRRAQPARRRPRLRRVVDRLHPPERRRHRATRRRSSARSSSLRAAGVIPRASAAATSCRDAARRAARDGSIGGQVNLTAFGILALRAGGAAARRRSARRDAGSRASRTRRRVRLRRPRRRERRRRHRRGAGGAGRAGRRGRGDRARRRRLPAPPAGPRRRLPAHAGGPAPTRSRPPRPSRASIAAGVTPAPCAGAAAASPLGYLRSLTGADGAVRYSRTQTPDPGVGHRPGADGAGRKPLPLAGPARALGAVTGPA